MTKNSGVSSSESNESTSKSIKAETQRDAALISSESPSESADHQGRQEYFMDIDRMVNEGLGGGNVTLRSGLIEESTTDTMNHPESVIDNEDG
jgi:hypothetical protein